MSKVTHLPRNFDEQFYGAAERIQQELPLEYKRFLSFIKRKNLVKATRFIEDLYKKKISDFSRSMLAQMCEKTKSQHGFRDSVSTIVERWVYTSRAIGGWLHLMQELGGPKNAQRLVRKHRRQLPAPEPWKVLSHVS